MMKKKAGPMTVLSRARNGKMYLKTGFALTAEWVKKISRWWKLDK